MQPPRLRVPRSIIGLTLLVHLGLVFGFVMVAGDLWKTLFGGNASIEIGVRRLVHDEYATGVHALGGTADAPARLLHATSTVRLSDVARLPYLGVRLLEDLGWLAECLALLMLDRILLQLSRRKAFAHENARRCRWIGWFMLMSYGFAVAAHLVKGALVDRAQVDGLGMVMVPQLHELGFSSPMLAFAGFCAAAVLRYGSDLEDEQAMTV